MKRAITFVFLLTLFSLLYSAPISVEEARLVSRNFLSERYMTQNINIQIEDIQLQYTEFDAEGTPVFYRFSIKEDYGFIIISATNQATPILAYSVEAVYRSNPAAEYMLGKYKRQIGTVKNKRSASSTEISSLWEHFLQEDFTPVRTRNNFVDPLITTTWSQETYYNTYCPYDPTIDINDQRSVVGCVGLNIATIRNYYQYPTKGVGGVSYYPTYVDNEPVYPRQIVNFSEHTYNYSALTDIPRYYNGELAKLIYHSGVSALLKYGYGYDPQSPNAPNGTSGHSTNAIAAFRNNWKYNQGIFVIDAEAILSGNNSNYVKWGDTIKTELDALRPVYYSATTAAGAAGHAWMLDGYDANGLFHMNWGWGGFGNGYYQINFIVDPQESSGLTSYNTNETAIFKLFPADTNLAKPDTSFIRNTASVGVITDGPGHLSYKNNSVREWVVAAPKAKSYTFKFAKLKTEINNDVINFYDARTKQLIHGPISGHYLNAATNDNGNETGLFPDGVTLPPSFTLNRDSVLITFTTNASVTDNGFVLYYEATLAAASACSPSSGSFLNSAEGTLSDGSGNYRAESGCSWRIKPSESHNLTKLTFNFNKFDLKAGDFVDVFDMTGALPQLYKRFDIYNMPTGPFTCNFLDIKIDFKSDNWLEGEGFVLQYGGSTEIDENSGLQDLAIYPNPTSHLLNVDFSTEKSENITFTIIDITGKIIFAKQVNHAGGNLNHQFNVSDLANGFYFLRIDTQNGKTIRKFIVE